jgi:hypothetical protein
MYKDHPLAAKYPLLEGEEYEELKESIREHGLLNPIWLYEGKVLDGRNRYRVCRELGIEPEFAEYEGNKPEGFGKAQNLDRRHLTPEWRRAQVKAKRAEGKSIRQIADEMEIHKTQVERDLSTVWTPDPDDTPEETPEPAPVVTGRDGKKYAAKKPQGKRRKPAAAQPELKDFVECLTKASQFADDGRQFWAAVKTLEGDQKWELADQIEELLKPLRRRATELRNR